MKKTFYIFLISLFHLFSAQVYAQPATPYSPNFQITDMDGVPHDLYTFLDAGRTVVIEFFTVNSPVSENSREGMNILQSTYGTEGDFSMMFFGVEMDTSNSAENQYVADHTITFPIINDFTALEALYGAKESTPMFIIICPDRLWKVRYGSIFDDTSLILNLSNQCNELSDRVRDGKILHYFGEDQFCEGELTAELYLQNYSETNNLTSAKISAWEGTELRGTTTWNGFLEPYELDTVSFDLFDLDTLSDIVFRLDSINLMPDTFIDNNSIERTLEEGPQVGPQSTLEIYTDFNPEQTTWYIEDVNGDIFYESSLLWPNSFNSLGLYMYEEGCFRFVIEDSFGDGIINGTTPEGEASGSVKIYNHLGDTIFNENDFENGTSLRFYVNPNLDLNELNPTNFAVYPNPSTGDVHIVLDEDQIGSEVSVYNLLGTIVYQNIKTDYNYHLLSTNKWAKGIYIIEVKNGSKLSSQKLILR